MVKKTKKANAETPGFARDSEIDSKNVNIGTKK
jgi:hypothetical protein